MFLLNDIYYKVDSSIVEQGFWQASITEKKALVDKELKKYAISKLQELNLCHQFIGNEKASFSVGELINILANNIPKEQHFDTLRHFIHYILKVAESIQNWSITWWVEDNEELIETPFVEFNDNGLWDSLITHNDTDYVYIFNFIYDIFNNHFYVKNEQKRIRIKLKDAEKL